MRLADLFADCEMRRSPPKVLWLLMGNCTTGQVEDLIRARGADIMAFAADPDAGALAIA